MWSEKMEGKSVFLSNGLFPTATVTVIAKNYETKFGA